MSPVKGKLKNLRKPEHSPPPNVIPQTMQPQTITQNYTDIDRIIPTLPKAVSPHSFSASTKKNYFVEEKPANNPTTQTSPGFTYGITTNPEIIPNGKPVLLEKEKPHDDSLSKPLPKGQRQTREPRKPREPREPRDNSRNRNPKSDQQNTPQVHEESPPPKKEPVEVPQDDFPEPKIEFLDDQGDHPQSRQPKRRGRGQNRGKRNFPRNNKRQEDE